MIANELAKQRKFQIAGDTAMDVTDSMVCFPEIQQAAYKSNYAGDLYDQSALLSLTSESYIRVPEAFVDCLRERNGVIADATAFDWAGSFAFSRFRKLGGMIARWSGR